MASSSRATKQVFGLLLLVLLFLALWLWPKQAAPTTTEPVPAVVTNQAAKSVAVAATPAPAAMPEGTVEALFARNAEPGRLVFLRFKLDSKGVRLSGASDAAGRASAPWPGTLRPGMLVYELRDSEGRLVLQGETEDPLNRRFEYEDSTAEGHLSAKMVSYEQGELMLRLPGQLNPRSIEFFRHQTGLPDNRLSLGRLSLR